MQNKNTALVVAPRMVYVQIESLEEFERLDLPLFGMPSTKDLCKVSSNLESGGLLIVFLHLLA